MSILNQHASIAAWNDEQHVRENRDQYRQKFQVFQEVLGDALPLSLPDAGFYFWADTNSAGKGSDQDFAVKLFAEQNITVLPGSLLGRETDSINPGANRVRMALVAPVEECREAAERIKAFVENSGPES